LERKGALRCVKRISNANIFDAAISRDDAQGRLIDDIVGLFGGRGKPVMARLIESGKLAPWKTPYVPWKRRRISLRE
jgi:hypothetical protein